MENVWEFAFDAAFLLLKVLGGLFVIRVGLLFLGYEFYIPYADDVLWTVYHFFAGLFR